VWNSLPVSFVSLRVFKRTLLSAIDLSKLLVFSVSYRLGSRAAPDSVSC